jgi:hypothetical protein
MFISANAWEGSRKWISVRLQKPAVLCTPGWDCTGEVKDCQQYLWREGNSVLQPAVSGSGLPSSLAFPTEWAPAVQLRVIQFLYPVWVGCKQRCVRGVSSFCKHFHKFKIPMEHFTAALTLLFMFAMHKAVAMWKKNGNGTASYTTLFPDQQWGPEIIW